MSKTLCVGSIDYSQNTRLDGKPSIWVRLRLLCDADGKSLWIDKFSDINDARQSLIDNKIEFYEITEECPDLFVARAKSSSMNELTEWNSEAPNDGLCVRTFITIMDGGERDLFDQDSCWLTSLVGGYNINKWFHSIKRLKSN